MILSLMLFGIILTPRHVKLYYNGAIMEYTAEVELKKGINRFYLTGIPKKGVQILDVKAGKGFEITDYHFIDSISNAQGMKNLKRRYDSLLDLKNVLTEEGAIILREQAFLKKILNTNNDSIMVNVKNLTALLDTIKIRSITLEKKRLKIEKHLNNIKNRLKKLSDSISIYLGPAIELNAVSMVNRYSTIKIRAFTSGIYYNLVFNINAEPDKKRGIISSFASVHNYTGIELKNVSLSVFTQSYERMRLPDIVPTVYYYPEHKYSKRRTLNSAGVVSVEEMEMAPPSHLRPSKKQYALGEMFTLKGKYNIKKSIMVPVFYDTVDAVFVRKTYPRKYQDVYLFATLTARKYPVYLKDIRVLIDGVYQGKFSYSSRDIAYSGDTFTVNFGKDSKVLVSRKRIKEYNKSSWTGTKTKEFTYRITLYNTRQNPVDIIVYDNLPVLRSDEYKLKDVKITPSGYELNDETGIIKWTLKLNEREQKELNIHYEISK